MGWPIHHHGDGAANEHLLDCPARKMNGGSLAGDYRSSAAAESASAQGRGQSVGDAVSARHRDQFAGRMNRRHGH